MKKILITFGILLTTMIGVNAQSDVSKGAQIEFETEVIDYGTIAQNADGVREFKFKNTGSEPLIISNAKGSCGCTVPEWPKQPILPGESAVMTVKYDTKRVGPINKSVTITSNAANEPTKVIRIKGKVLGDETPASSAPVKTPSPGAPVSE